MKHIIIFLIFFFSATISVLADSFHVQVDTHPDSVSSSRVHHGGTDYGNETQEHSNDDAGQSSDHCQDHEECHSGHFHHYLASNLSTVIISNLCMALDFPASESFYSDRVTEIIKPPIALI